MDQQVDPIEQHETGTGLDLAMSMGGRRYRRKVRQTPTCLDLKELHEAATKLTGLAQDKIALVTTREVIAEWLAEGKQEVKDTKEFQQALLTKQAEKDKGACEIIDCKYLDRKLLRHSGLITYRFKREHKCGTCKRKRYNFINLVGDVRCIRCTEKIVWQHSRRGRVPIRIVVMKLQGLLGSSKYTSIIN